MKNDGKMRKDENRMKKAELIALGISEELAAKAEKTSQEELKAYVEKSKYDEAVNHPLPEKTGLEKHPENLFSKVLHFIPAITDSFCVCSFVTFNSNSYSPAGLISTREMLWK